MRTGFGLAGSFQIASILTSAFPPARNPGCLSSCCCPREGGGRGCCSGLTWRASCCQLLFVAMALGGAGVGVFDVCSQPSRHYICATLFFTCGGLFMASYSQPFLVAFIKGRHESSDRGFLNSNASSDMRPPPWLQSQKDHRIDSNDQHLKSVDVWDVGYSGSALNNGADASGGGVGRAVSDSRFTGRFNSRSDRNGMPYSTSVDGVNSGLLPHSSVPTAGWSKLPNVPSDDVVVQGMCSNDRYFALAGTAGVRSSRSSDRNGRNNGSSSFLAWLERGMTSACGRTVLLVLYWTNYIVVLYKLHGPTNVDGKLVSSTSNLSWRSFLFVCH